MQSSASVLLKNVKNLPNGLLKFASASSQAYATFNKIKDRQFNYAPESVRDQAEVIEQSYQKRALCQDKNMWVDKELSTEVSQKDLAQLHQYKQDYWRATVAASGVAVMGGYALPALAWGLSHDTWTPSQFASNDAELLEYRKAIDMYRYKYAPTYLMDIRWNFEHHAQVPTKYSANWEELNECNEFRRDPALCRDVTQFYDGFNQFFHFRRKQGRAMARAMGIPTNPTWSKICIQNRIKTFWELAWNEDYMVISQNLTETMSDAELFDYAWRRFLAPADKDLSREQVAQRVADYHTFLGPKFVEDGVAPNIFITTAYCLGNYNEAPYLTEDIAALDSNDFDHIKDIPQDAFLKRLEFENGPLRDQVEAHTQKLVEERKKAAEALSQ